MAGTNADPLGGAEALRLRQARHRLRVAVTPSEPPPAGADPWVIAHEALIALGTVRGALRDRARVLDCIDTVELRIRWLAVGPQD